MEVSGAVDQKEIMEKVANSSSPEKRRRGDLGHPWSGFLHFIGPGNPQSSECLDLLLDTEISNY